MTDQRYMRPGINFAVGKAVEELGELQAALGKTLRWGWLSANPELPLYEQETNADWVAREIKDVRGALNNLEKEMAEAQLLPAAANEEAAPYPRDPADCANWRGEDGLGYKLGGPASSPVTKARTLP